MKKYIKGQSKFDECLNIEYDSQNCDDTDIDRMIKDAQIFKEQSKHIYEQYLNRTIENINNIEFSYDNTYNARLFDYPTGQHITFYQKGIQKQKKVDNLSRSYINKNRTEKDKEHCICVSMNKTKNNIYNIARSHEWKWFVTFTFNRQKTDATDYDLVTKRLRFKLNNTQKRKCPNLKYLIVPELHKDGENYHFHGLLSNCDELEFIFSGHFDKSNRPIFNIPDWSWGWSTATLVGDTTKASGYICKYVTKDSERYLYNKRRYFSNAKKTDSEKLVVIDPLDFIETYANDITYIKQSYIKEAHQKITYLEIPY